MNPLEHALDELRSALIEFVSLLEREASALQLGQNDELATVVAEKTGWAEAASTAWNRLVIASGIDVTKGESLDQALGADPRFQAGWQDVRRLAKTAERLNHGNSALIEAQLQRTRLALDVLQSASNRTSLYGANGRMVDGFSSGHTLDKV